MFPVSPNLETKPIAPIRRDRLRLLEEEGEPITPIRKGRLRLLEKEGEPITPKIPETIEDLPMSDRMSKITAFLEKEPAPSLIERIIDILGRSEYASAGVFEEYTKQVRGEKPRSIFELGKEAWKGLSGEEKKRYIDILEEQGMKPGWKRTVLGFVAGTLLDPLTYVPIGWVGKPISWVAKGVKGTEVTKVLAPMTTVQRVGKTVGDMVEERSLKPLIHSIEVSKLRPYFNEDLIMSGLKEARDIVQVLPSQVRGEIVAAQKALIKAVPEIKKINPIRRTELTHIAEKNIELPSNLTPIERTFIEKFRKTMDNIYESEKPKGLIAGVIKGKPTYIHPYVEHILTKEGRDLFNYINVPGRLSESERIAVRGLMKVFETRPIPERTLMPGQNFLGVKLKEGTIQEINNIAATQITTLKGRPLFDEDLGKIWLNRVGLSVKNQLIHDNLTDFGYKWWKAGLFKPFTSKTDIVDPASKFPRSFTNALQFTPDSLKARIIKTVTPKTEIPTTLTPGYKEFSITPLKGLQGPVAVVDEIEKTFDIVLREKPLKTFVDIVDKHLIRPFKWGVTIPFPSFHGLNLLGGQFNNYLALGLKLIPRLKDTSEVLNPFSKKVWKVSTTGEKITAQELFKLYQRSGASYAWSAGELQIRPFSPLKTKISEGLTLPFRVAKAPFEWTAVKVEDLNRLPIFIDEYLKTGDIRKASLKVYKYQFNYAPEGLSKFEQETLRRIIPFYVFWRNNALLQFEQIYKQTGKYSTLFRGVSLGGPDHDERDELLPDWQKRELLLNVPEYFAQKFKSRPEEKIYLSLRLPIADAMASMTPEDLASAVHPLATAPIEWFFNKKLFFGNQIWNPDLPSEMQTSKAYPILKALPPSLQDFVEFRESYRVNPVTGQLEIAYRADSKKLYILRKGIIPYIGPFLSRAYYETGKSSEYPTTFGKIWSLLSPLKVRKVTPGEKEYWDMQEKKRRIENIKRELRKDMPIPEEIKELPLTELESEPEPGRGRLHR